MANFAAPGMTGAPLADIEPGCARQAGQAAVRAWATFAREPEGTVAWT